MGEVDEPQHAVDHRVAERYQPVHGALGDARYHQPPELGAGEAGGVGIGPAGEGVVGVDLLGDERPQPDDDDPDGDHTQEREEAVDPGLGRPGAGRPASDHWICPTDRHIRRCGGCG